MKSWAIILFFIAIGINFNSKASEIDPFSSSFTSNHEIVLLNHGLASLEERLEMIERATKSIEVEYYIYNVDQSGRIFTQALLKKAREGVKVRMLLDYLNVKNELSPFYAHELEKSGVEIKYFNTASILNFPTSQYRNHRKVLIIDGVEAITGGRNIADEYFDMKTKFNFLDRDIEVKGDVVASILDTFNQIWDSEISKKVERSKMPELRDTKYYKERGSRDVFRYWQDLKAWNKKIEDAQSFLTNSDTSLLETLRAKGREELALEFHGNCESMSFHSEYPGVGGRNRDGRIIKYDVSNRIKNAKESILFDSPYFIVDDESKVALETALGNDVKIRLLTNSLNSTDAVFVYAAFDHAVKNWIAKGLMPYIYKGNIPENYATYTDEIKQARFGVHAKTFVFDNKDVVIGTFNFDPRSANINTEMTISCENNPELAKIVTEDIESRIKESVLLDSRTKVDEMELYNTSLLKKISYFALKIPADIFDFLL